MAHPDFCLAPCLAPPVFFLIYRSSSFGWHRSYTYTVDNFVGPLLFPWRRNGPPTFLILESPLARGQKSVFVHSGKISLRGPGFILLRFNPLSQRKIPKVILLSRMLCFGRLCASPCALNVSAALQGAYTGAGHVFLQHDKRFGVVGLFDYCFTRVIITE